MVSPARLDGARVLEVANVTASASSGATRHFLDGALINSQFEHLAIARYADDPSDGVYLFYCDESWTVLTDTWHESVADARTQAALEYPVGPFAG